MDFTFVAAAQYEYISTKLRRMSDTRLCCAASITGGTSYSRAKVAVVNPSTGGFTMYESAQLAPGVNDTCPMSSSKFVFLGAGAAVCSFDGAAISVGPTYSYPFAGSNWIAAALSESKFVLIGVTTNGTATKAVVGTISGTAITFGAPVTFYSGYGRYMDVVCLSSSSFVVCYSTNSQGGEPAYLVAGEVASSTITIAANAGTSLGGRSFGIDCVDAGIVVALYHSSATGYLCARCARVASRTITLAPAINVVQSYDGSICSLSPRVVGLFPKMFAVGYHVSAYPKGRMYLCGLWITDSNSSTLTLTECGGPIYAGLENDKYNRCSPRVVKESDWRVACSIFGDYNAGIRTAFIAQPNFSMAFGATEQVAIPPSTPSIWTARSFASAVDVSELVGLRPSPRFSEALSVDEEYARQLLLSLSVPERLMLWSRGIIDGRTVGDDAQLWMYFDEWLVGDDVAGKRVGLAGQESLGASDRLRLGGVFDEPTTKIVTSIIKAALQTERL